MITFARASTCIATIVLIGCGSGSQPPPASSTSAAASGPAGSPSSNGSEVVGTIAPAVAPPASLVALVPRTPVDLPVKTDAAVINQAGYEFLPGFLVAQAGQRVEFRNGEDVLHNVRVTEASQQKPVFNVATVAFGKYDHTFEPGIYNVTCDIHPTMRATILVTATPYTASVADNGGFSIANVRPGAYKLTIYSPSGPVERDVDVVTGRTDLGAIQ